MQTFKRFDTRKHLTGTVLDENGTPVDLTQFASVRLFAGPQDSGVLLVNGGTVTGLSNGSFDYGFDDGALAIAGVWEYELECIDSAGKRQTYPDSIDGPFGLFTVLADKANYPLSGTMTGGTVTVNATTLDVNSVALGVIPNGALVTAMADHRVVADTVVVGGAWSLVLKSGLTYTVIVTQEGFAFPAKTVKL